MKPLRLVGSDETAPSSSEPELAFTFQRRRRGTAWVFEVGLYDRRNGRNSWSSLREEAPGLYGKTVARHNLETARGWARSYAEIKGFPYAETSPRSPDLTPDQLRRSRVNHYSHAVLAADKQAEGAIDPRVAAEEWLHAARWCEKLAEVVPGKEDFYGKCAASRVAMAMSELRNYRVRLLAMKPGDSLREVKKGD